MKEIRDTPRPTMSDEEMAKDYPRLKREYALLHEDYRRAISKQCDIPVVVGRSEQLKAFLSYVQESQKEGEMIVDNDKFIDGYLKSL